jgi:hypothetical protein
MATDDSFRIRRAEYFDTQVNPPMQESGELEGKLQDNFNEIDRLTMLAKRRSMDAAKLSRRNKLKL